MQRLPGAQLPGFLFLYAKIRYVYIYLWSCTYIRMRLIYTPRMLSKGVGTKCIDQIAGLLRQYPKASLRVLFHYARAIVFPAIEAVHVLFVTVLLHLHLNSVRIPRIESILGAESHERKHGARKGYPPISRHLVQHHTCITVVLCYL